MNNYVSCFKWTWNCGHPNLNNMPPNTDAVHRHYDCWLIHWLATMSAPDYSAIHVTTAVLRRFECERFIFPPWSREIRLIKMLSGTLIASGSWLLSSWLQIYSIVLYISAKRRLVRLRFVYLFIYRCIIRRQPSGSCYWQLEIGVSVQSLHLIASMSAV